MKQKVGFYPTMTKAEFQQQKYNSLGHEQSTNRQRNKQIRWRMGTAPMLNKMEALQLRWLGHLERISEGKVINQRWKWKPGGTRPRGWHRGHIEQT